MFTPTDLRDWADMPIATINERIPPYITDNATLSFTYHDFVTNPLPNSGFILTLGGNRIRGGRTVDTREEVLCVEKITDTKYIIQRDPMGVGIVPKEHMQGDPVFHTVIGGSIKSIDKRLSILEKKLTNFEEALSSISVDEKYVLPCFKKEITSNGGLFNVSVLEQKEEYIILKISSGVVLLNDSDGYSRLFSIHPDEETLNKSIVIIKTDVFFENDPLYVYINKEYDVLCSDGKEDAFKDKHNNSYVLCKINVENGSFLGLEDARPDILKNLEV